MDGACDMLCHPATLGEAWPATRPSVARTCVLTFESLGVSVRTVGTRPTRRTGYTYKRWP